MRKNKVLLIGWDAADWKIIGPLLAKGQMPALKKIIVMVFSSYWQNTR